MRSRCLEKMKTKKKRKIRSRSKPTMQAVVSGSSLFLFFVSSLFNGSDGSNFWVENQTMLYAVIPILV